MFDENYESNGRDCYCCYVCIKKHAEEECNKCVETLDMFIAPKSQKLTKSVATEVREAFEELFSTLKMNTILVEGELEIKTSSLIKDFLKMSDEIKSVNDIVNLWHIDRSIAKNMFMLFDEIVFGNFDILSDASDKESDSDTLDGSSDDD